MTRRTLIKSTLGLALAPCLKKRQVKIKVKFVKLPGKVEELSVLKNTAVEVIIAALGIEITPHYEVRVNHESVGRKHILKQGDFVIVMKGMRAFGPTGCHQQVFREGEWT